MTAIPERPLNTDPEISHPAWRYAPHPYPSPKSGERVGHPAGGVTGIAVIFASAALALAVLAVMTAFARLPLAAGAFLVGSGMEIAGPAVFLVFAVLAAITAAGLLRLASWARWLAIGLAAWGMWQAVPAISSAVVDFRVLALLREGIAFIVRGVIVWYLMQGETKETFGRGTSLGAS
jgi:hypothetical protein